MRNTLLLKIDGMHCGACVRRVQAALGKVGSVNVRDVQIGSAEVDYDPRAVSADGIVAAVNSIGFSAAVQPASNQ
jgi:copper chaperone